MRDPKVWGIDADEFKLRDLKKYEELSVAWMEQGMNKEQPQHSRNCPGKELSFAMMTGMWWKIDKKMIYYERDL